MAFSGGGPDYLIEDRGYATPCWIWQGCVGGDSGTNGAGYGILFRDGYRGVAHRWFYTRAHGPIPEGAVLDHLCDIRACVNPDHLEPVTQAENVRRSPLAKLTEDQAMEIRRLADEGAMSQPEIGALFGVGQQCVSLIKQRKRWATPGGVVHA